MPITPAADATPSWCEKHLAWIAECEANHRVQAIEWAATLSDGQLVCAIYKAECNDSAAYCETRFLNDWQAKARNRRELEILRAEKAFRDQKEAA